MFIHADKSRFAGPKRLKPMVAVALASVALSGCVIDGPPPGGGSGNVASRPAFADGNWGDATGVATATLTSGSFVSTANDTGNRLAEGSYVYTGSSTLALNYFSLVRQSTIRVNCILANASTLNCTNDAGQKFQLFRRAAV